MKARWAIRHSRVFISSPPYRVGERLLLFKLKRKLSIYQPRFRGNKFSISIGSPYQVTADELVIDDCEESASQAHTICDRISVGS